MHTYTLTANTASKVILLFLPCNANRFLFFVFDFVFVFVYFVFLSSNVFLLLTYVCCACRTQY